MGYEFLPLSELQVIDDLPDVLGGVGTPEEWDARRPYLKAMLSHYMLGARPADDVPARGEVLSSAPVYGGLGVRDEVRLWIVWMVGNRLIFMSCARTAPGSSRRLCGRISPSSGSADRAGTGRAGICARGL